MHSKNGPFGGGCLAVSGPGRRLTPASGYRPSLPEVPVAASSATLHEDPNVLSAETKDRHRAIVSIMEELEAVDWYDQRAAACSDPELAAILAHNRDEEKEHAMMTLEWLRRHDPA